MGTLQKMNQRTVKIDKRRRKMN